MKHLVEALKNEKTITFNPRGNSMTPKIKSGQSVTIERLSDKDKEFLRKGDIVFCKVGGNYYLHLISAITPAQKRCQISNNHGKVNGWTDFSNVFAKLI